MRVISAHGLQKRILSAACSLDCKNIQLAKQGKKSKETDESIFELMFIHEFLPFWNREQIRQKECYLNDKYGI